MSLRLLLVISVFIAAIVIDILALTIRSSAFRLA